MSEITSDILAKIAPGTPKAKRDRFIPYYNECLPRYGITTELRVAAFLTTVCFESDYFKALAEYADGMAYDITRNRKKALALGNTEPGDGPKYKGAGGIETTGKKNYQRLSDRLGVDFVNNPNLLRTEKYFVEAACVFWDDNHFNKLADQGKIIAIQNLTNRGSVNKPALALSSRVKIYQNVLHILPDDFNLSATTSAADQSNLANGPLDASLDGSNSGQSPTIKQEANTIVNAGDMPSPPADPEAKTVITAMQPYMGVGFIGVIKKDIAKLTGGNVTLQTISSYRDDIAQWGIPAKLLLNLAILGIIASVVYLLCRLIHYLVWIWREHQRIKIEERVNSDQTKPNVQWEQSG